MDNDENLDDLNEIKAALKALQKKMMDLDVSKVPLGTIMSFGGEISVLNNNWLPCDGRALPRIGEYESLFRAIGTLWGDGDGVSSFNLPDLQGQFLRGIDGGSGKDKDAKDRLDVTGKKKLGSIVGSYQNDDFGEHDHSIQDNQHAHIIKRGFLGNGPGGYSYGGAFNGGSEATDDPDRKTTTPSPSNINVLKKGGKETRPINAAVIWIIKVKQEN